MYTIWSYLSSSFHIFSLSSSYFFFFSALYDDSSTNRSLISFRLFCFHFLLLPFSLSLSLSLSLSYWWDPFYRFLLCCCCVLRTTTAKKNKKNYLLLLVWVYTSDYFTRSGIMRFNCLTSSDFIEVDIYNSLKSIFLFKYLFFSQVGDFKIETN